MENNRVPTSSSQCATGFDPAVHPYLFVGADPRVGLKELYEISPKNDSFVFSARYITGRGHLDLDVIETDLGRVAFNTREGVWGKNTIEGLDDLDNFTSWMALNPGIFRSTTVDEIYYDMHFYVKPAYLEVLDIYGDGIRWEVDDTQSSTSAQVSSSGQASNSTDASTTSGSSNTDGTESITSTTQVSSLGLASTSTKASESSGVSHSEALGALALLTALQLYIP